MKKLVCLTDSLIGIVLLHVDPIELIRGRRSAVCLLNN